MFTIIRILKYFVKRNMETDLLEGLVGTLNSYRKTAYYREYKKFRVNV